jgi:hypothetical protein
VNGKNDDKDCSALDRLDKFLVPRDLIDWSVVQRDVCDSCDSNQTANSTFSKGMRGIWLNIDTKNSYRFGSVQNVVDYVVTWLVIWFADYT